jgi:hypothetical protein
MPVGSVGASHARVALNEIWRETMYSGKAEIVVTSKNFDDADWNNQRGREAALRKRRKSPRAAAIPLNLLKTTKEKI